MLLFINDTQKTMALGKQKSDTLLAIAVVGLVFFGIVMIYSASVILGYTLFGDDKFFFKRQIVWAVAGLISMVVAANVEYHFWKKWAGWMLGATFVLLISVFFFSGDAINGAHRWIYIGSQGFQPAELAKLTFLIYISAWLSMRKEQVKSIKGTFLPFMAVIGALSVLMLMQPDFGTLSIMLVSVIAVYIVAGLTWQQSVLGLGLSTGALGLIMLEPYRRARLLTFLHPTHVTSDASYHIDNISIALGSGGWFGLGFGQSAQKRLFLPEPHTDSIFAIITEELGFVIAMLVIAAFVFVVYRGYRIAARSRDPFAKLLAVGIVSWLAFQAFINLASMLGIVPLVGVPLPFISYGGTNLLISLTAVGILLNISRYAQDPVEEPKRVVQPARRTRQKS